jgi:lipoprotein-anchoring transpeptidase ErfK/SrfK
VGRAGLGALLALCALAGALVSVLFAGPIPAATGTTGTTTEPPPTVPTPPPTTPPPPPAPPPPAVLPAGVKIGGLDVGGLTPDAAAAVVRAGFAAPLVLNVAGRTLKPTPQSLGAVAYVQNAVAKARTAQPGTNVELFVRVDGPRVRRYVNTVGTRFDRRPADASLVLRNLRPFLTAERPGRTLDRPGATKAIVDALKANQRLPIALTLRPTQPTVTRRNFGEVVVVHRGSNQLKLYTGTRLVRTFRVATGKSRYPTPLGRFRVITKWANPWWYPPDSDWAKGLKPVPPGPGNPLGTRWMGISSPGVGIHGTPDSASLGYSVSHGCIRMAIPEAEWLFQRVKIGTTVFIVAA